MPRNVRLDKVRERIGFTPDDIIRAVSIYGQGYGSPAVKIAEELGIKKKRYLGRVLAEIEEIEQRNKGVKCSRKIWYCPPHVRKNAIQGVKYYEG